MQPGRYTYGNDEYIIEFYVDQEGPHFSHTGRKFYLADWTRFYVEPDVQQAVEQEALEAEYVCYGYTAYYNEPLFANMRMLPQLEGVQT